MEGRAEEKRIVKERERGKDVGGADSYLYQPH